MLTRHVRFPVRTRPEETIGSRPLCAKSRDRFMQESPERSYVGLGSKAAITTVHLEVPLSAISRRRAPRLEVCFVRSEVVEANQSIAFGARRSRPRRSSPSHSGRTKTACCRQRAPSRDRGGRAARLTFVRSWTRCRPAALSSASCS